MDQVMQLGNDTHALLIPVWKYGISVGVEMLLKSQSTTKLVWGPDDEREFDKMDIALNGVVDVQQLSCAMGYSKKLEMASKQLLVNELEQYRKKSGFNHKRFRKWDREPLPYIARKYAAHDVFSLYHIFERIRNPHLEPLGGTNDELFESLLTRRHFECSGIALFKQSMHLMAGEPNEISKLNFFVQVLVSFDDLEEPLLQLYLNSDEYPPSIVIYSISECIEFLEDVYVKSCDERLYISTLHVNKKNSYDTIHVGDGDMEFVVTLPEFGITFYNN